MSQCLLLGRHAPSPADPPGRSSRSTDVVAPALGRRLATGCGPPLRSRPQRDALPKAGEAFEPSPGADARSVVTCGDRSGGLSGARLGRQGSQLSGCVGRCSLSATPWCRSMHGVTAIPTTVPAAGGRTSSSSVRPRSAVFTTSVPRTSWTQGGSMSKGASGSRLAVAVAGPDRRRLVGVAPPVAGRLAWRGDHRVHQDQPVRPAAGRQASGALKPAIDWATRTTCLGRIGGRDDGVGLVGRAWRPAGWAAPTGTTACAGCSSSGVSRYQYRAPLPAPGHSTNVDVVTAAIAPRRRGPPAGNLSHRVRGRLRVCGARAPTSRRWTELHALDPRQQPGYDDDAEVARGRRPASNPAAAGVRR